MHEINTTIGQADAANGVLNVETNLAAARQRCYDAKGGQDSGKTQAGNVETGHYRAIVPRVATKDKFSSFANRAPRPKKI